MNAGDPSKHEFCCYLNESWIICTDDFSKGRSADDTVNGTRAKKLGVIEGVKRLKPDLQRF